MENDSEKRIFFRTVKTRHLTILIFILSFFSHCSYPAKNNINTQQDLTRKETLYQVSTISAFFAGAYDGDKTFEELRKHGDFGFGFMDKLDGEMIALDGEFYKTNNDGQAFPVSDLMKTAFAAVTFFEMDKAMEFHNGPAGFATLKKFLDNLITDKSMFYAIRIDGEFISVKTRSIPAQIKPYRRLDEIIINEQNIHELQEVRGTMVGFWYPIFSGGINVSGYHFHFITEDRTRGGHVLDCNCTKGKIQVDLTPHIHIELLTSQHLK